MKIKVKFNTLNKNQLNDVITFFNLNKPCNWNKLEKLDRIEGGFQIRLNEEEIKNNKNRILDDNYKIKQLRWNNKKLCSFEYINFNDEELLLLYRSLQYVFGSHEVEII